MVSGPSDPGVKDVSLVTEGHRFALVAARFNNFITQELIDGVMDGLTHHGVPKSEIEIVWVPGALEIPLAAQWIAKLGRVDAIICLGAVIRGATSHYDVVVNSCSSGVARVALDSGIPIIFGVLTTDNIEQAIERSGTNSGNKGYEFAVAAIEMANLRRSLSS